MSTVRCLSWALSADPCSLIFILYIEELFNIIAGHGLRAHCYADDTQIYISMPATDIPSTVQRFVQCMDDVSEWMARNQLKMNTEKTQLIWLRTSQQLRKVSVTELTLPSGLIQFVNSVTNLGLHIDSELTMLPPRLCLPHWVLSAEAATDCSRLTYHVVCPDNGAFIHQQSLRLLQQPAVRHQC